MRLAFDKDFVATAIKFAATGGINSALGLAVIYGLKWLLGVGDISANMIGYGVGILVSFVLNARWTFSYRGPLAPAFPLFLLVLALAYVANLAVVLLLIDVLHVNSYVAQALGVPPYALIAFFGSRHLVFGLTKPSEG